MAPIVSKHFMAIWKMGPGLVFHELTGSLFFFFLIETDCFRSAFIFVGVSERNGDRKTVNEFWYFLVYI